MKAVRSWNFRIRLFAAGLGFLLFSAGGLQGSAWPHDTNRITVTCELSSYADGWSGDGWRMVATNEGPSAVSGVVLRIVEPKNLSGQLLSFHFDGPPIPSYRWFYEPGLRYRGQVDQRYIGTLAFMCDPGLECTELQEPLPFHTPHDLGRLVRERHWNDQYLLAIRKQFGDKMLFQVLYRFLTETNQSSPRLEDQRRAAKYLVKFQPVCDVPLSLAMRETLRTWDETISDWPLYLWRAFDQAKLLNALAQVETRKLSGAEREKLEIWHYWLGGSEKDLENSSAK